MIGNMGTPRNFQEVTRPSVRRDEFCTEARSQNSGERCTGFENELKDQVQAQEWYYGAGEADGAAEKCILK
ncbi:hypothetical protein BGAL_0024g00290 [Botrytis galanthina]|uniref:Uncharacterized protein n=1 Tax=Botrytis galanthina TaxID=278940 RepID=A0A4S8RLI3_9HELO|nr:hypothetical protein BGAL_0024g00290 [Botrytis galanthina]